MKYPKILCETLEIDNEKIHAASVMGKYGVFIFAASDWETDVIGFIKAVEKEVPKRCGQYLQEREYRFIQITRQGGEIMNPELQDTITNKLMEKRFALAGMNWN